MIDASGKLLGRINVFDFSSLLILALVALGLVAVQSGWHTTSSQVVEGETDIKYAIYLRNVKALHPEQLFQQDDTVSITIRNRPRGEVKVLNSEYKPKQSIIPDGKGSYSLVADPDDQNGYDYIVWLKDRAVVTKESYVTNGVKVKIGMRMLVEDFSYQLPGQIIDIQALDSSAPTAQPSN